MYEVTPHRARNGTTFVVPSVIHPPTGPFLFLRRIFLPIAHETTFVLMIIPVFLFPASSTLLNNIFISKVPRIARETVLFVCYCVRHPPNQNFFCSEKKRKKNPPASRAKRYCPIFCFPALFTNRDVHFHFMNGSSPALLCAVHPLPPVVSIFCSLPTFCPRVCLSCLHQLSVMPASAVCLPACHAVESILHSPILDPTFLVGGTVLQSVCF